MFADWIYFCKFEFRNEIRLHEYMANGVIGYLKTRLQSLSVKTGVIVACVCVLCYAFSFLQMLLPVSAVLKGILWVVFLRTCKSLSVYVADYSRKVRFFNVESIFCKKSEIVCNG